ncbi:retrovirus-related pol polyprotein from transposon TNT 1-94 [Tanacetum coccineum]
MDQTNKPNATKITRNILCNFWKSATYHQIECLVKRFMVITLQEYLVSIPLCIKWEVFRFWKWIECGLDMVVDQWYFMVESGGSMVIAKSEIIIFKDESIDSAFARFNTIITSLKALDEGYSSKNYVRKFLRVVHPKWRAKVTAIEVSEDLTSLSLNELIGNLKVHEMIIKKDSEIVKAKVERKSLALKAKKESSDEECSTSGSKDEEYAMAVRDFKKFFKRRDLNHLIGECLKPLRDKNQRAFVGGSWSDSGEEDDEKIQDETCLVAQAPNEVCSESSYFSDENSSIDDLALDNEYDKLCKMCLKIITKNKKLKASRNSLEKELRELNDKLSTLEKNKGVDLECVTCHVLKIENEKLKDESTRLNKFKKITHCLNEMLSNQKPSGDKLGLGFNSLEASSSGTKEIKFVKAQKKAYSDRGPRPKHIIVNKTKVPVASENEVKLFYKPLSKTICLGVDLEPDEWIKENRCSKHMTSNRKLFSTYKAYNGGNIIFGSNLRGKIIGKGTISDDSLKIDNVEHVDNFGFNLLSIGKICDNKCRVTFSEYDSEITKDGKVIDRGIRKKGLYVMKLGNKPKDQICLTTIDENSTLWHRILGHTNMCLIQSLASKELVRNLPKLKFNQHFCDACKMGKQAHASHKAKNVVSTTRCLELLHMDLFGPSAIRSYGGNRYTLVIVDDYSRYTWTRFLKDKTKAFDQFEIFSRKIQNQLGCSIVSIRTDHGREFDNEVQFGEFCNANGITHNFSAPRTPQSNGVVERKNRTLQEMSRTMLNEQSLPQKFWCNTVDTSTYILNRILIRAILGKTPYELLRGTKWVFRNKLDENGIVSRNKASQDMCDEFAKIMHDEFEMSLMGELNFFLGLQIKQMEDGIFFNQSKYIKEMLKKFDLKILNHENPMSSDTKLNRKMRNVMSVDSPRRVVSLNLENMSHIRANFESIWLDYLLDINEQIIPHFVLEFYCQLTFNYNPEGQFIVNFVIQNKSFSLTLEEFGQILKIPFKGQASNTEMWSLDHLSVSVPSRGLYKTKPLSPRVIKSFIQVPRQGQETRTKNKKTVVIGENEILTREIHIHMKPWVDIICENAICLGGHKDHVSACLCHMLYCIETSTPYNLAFFILKRMEKTQFKPKELLPYGMLLTGLFKLVVSVSPELAFDHYLSYDRAMHPIAPHYERKTHKNRFKIGQEKSSVSKMLDSSFLPL